MKRRAYRSQAGIVYDILRALRDESPLPASRIALYARLPYDRLRPILERLVSRGLVAEERDGEKNCLHDNEQRA